MAAPAALSTPQNLGNPFLAKKSVYARNVWDMQLYNDKIYLGHGDSAANSGNTPIWSLDPKTSQFTNEFLTTTEQVDEFFPIGNELYTLDHDPTGVNHGNLYCTDGTAKGGGEWCVKKNIHGAVHQYSLAQHDGALYVGGSSGTGGSSVWRSADNGPWSGVLSGEIKTIIAGKEFSAWGGRVEMLLPVKGELYAIRGGWESKTAASYAGFYRLNANANANAKGNAKGGQFEIALVSGAVLSGGLATPGVVRYKRLVTLDDGSVLTLLVQSINDHQWNPLALMHVSEVRAGGINALALPGGAKPYDLLRRGNLIYVCAWDAGRKQNVVFSLPASNPKATPTEVLRFDAPTFARSFEESEGSFYFGMGCDVSPAPAQTGEIWKVALAKKPVVPDVPQTPTVPKPAPSPTPLPPVVEPETEPVGYSNGLSASYYRGMNLEGAALTKRIEKTVNFNVGNKVVVVPEAGAELWSANYQGFIEAPITGQIKLWTASDDGVRLFIDGQKLIDNWTVHGVTWNSTTLDVVRGQKLPIKLQYFQNKGGAALQLHWEWNGKRALVPTEYLWHTDTPAPPVVPAVPAVPAVLPTPLPTPAPTPTLPATSPGLSASYYRGMNLEGAPVAQRIEATINLGRGTAPKEAGNEKWSTSYEGFIEAPITGQIKLSTLSDDGVRLFIDGQKLIDNWTVHGVTWNRATLDVVRGQKLPIKLQYFQLNGNCALQLHWEWDIQNRVIIPNQSLSHIE